MGKTFKQWWNSRTTDEQATLLVIGGVSAVGVLASGFYILHKIRSGDVQEAVELAKGSFARTVEPSDKPYNILVTKLTEEGGVRALVSSSPLEFDDIAPAMRQFLEHIPKEALEKPSIRWFDVSGK